MTAAIAGYWAANRDAAERQAREDLLVMCGEHGDVNRHYIDWSAEHGASTHAAFVAMLERINSHLWQRQVGRAMTEILAEEF